MKNKKCKWLIALTIALLTIASTTSISLVSAQPPPIASDEPWPTFHQNQLHTGMGTGTAPANLAVKWKTDLNGQIVSSPAVAYGKVYVGSIDRNIYCLDAQSGTINWKYTTNFRQRSSPAVKDGKVYTGDDDGIIYCLDANTGSLVWKYDTGMGILPITESTYTIQSSPTVSGDKLYVGSKDSNVYCLDANTGAPLWKYKTGMRIYSTPTVYADKVYIGSWDGVFYALNAESGEYLWSYDTTEETFVRGSRTVGGTATIIEDLNMLVFYSNHNGRYIALDVDTGELIWEYYMMMMRPYKYAQSTCPRAYVTPCYVEELDSLFIQDDHLAMRLDVNTGTPLWPHYGSGGFWDVQHPDQSPGPAGIPTAEVSGDGFGKSPAPSALHTGMAAPNHLGWVALCSPAYADGKVYTGGHRGSFYCFDATSTDATRLSWYETGGFFDSSPAVAYGNVYVGCTTWFFYCFTDGAPRRLHPDDPTRTLPLLDSTSITGSLSTTEVEVEDWIYLEGKVNYESDATIWERALIWADFVKPDGSTWRANMMADWDGTYRVPYSPDMEGTWTVTPKWTGDSYNDRAEGTPLTFTVVAPTLPTPQKPPPPTGFSPVLIYALSIAVGILIPIVAFLILKRK
jgi:outer membrane protein assembly factor BamB